MTFGLFPLRNLSWGDALLFHFASRGNLSVPMNEFSSMKLIMAA